MTLGDNPTIRLHYSRNTVVKQKFTLITVIEISDQNKKTVTEMLSM